MRYTGYAPVSKRWQRFVMLLDQYHKTERELPVTRWGYAVPLTCKMSQPAFHFDYRGLARRNRMEWKCQTNSVEPQEGVEPSLDAYHAPVIAVILPRQSDPWGYRSPAKRLRTFWTTFILTGLANENAGCCLRTVAERG